MISVVDSTDLGISGSDSPDPVFIGKQSG